MTISSITLTNPGAESGTVGWNATTGVLTTEAGSQHSGSLAFWLPDFNPADTKFGQTITVDPTIQAAIDAGNAAVKAGVWIKSSNVSDGAALYVECYLADGTTLTGQQTNTYIFNNGSYTNDQMYFRVPPTTRKIRIGAYCDSTGATFSCRLDDFTLEISNDYLNDYPAIYCPLAHQLGVYALGIYPSAQARATQLPIAILAASETSNTLYQVKAHQLGAYALVRDHGDRRELRAWPFTQDDHDFYVINLGTVMTLVFDKLSRQWATWKSPGYAYWRGADGTYWEGFNLCCDTESGILWEIDAEGRLDDETTPITSIVTGGFTTRMRNHIPIYMAELAISEGQPPAGHGDGSVGISLRTSDDGGLSYYNHGTVTGGAIGDEMTVRWYGLGLAKSPGRVFEVTDTGYARRIDALDIELPDGQ